MARSGKLLYHPTALENLESILVNGLQSRAQLNGVDFEDVADGDILDPRQEHGLEQYVPFHFFARNPFDYSVQRTHPKKDFVLITVRRTLAQGGNWKIVPRHPLAEKGYGLLDYDEGIEAIEWQHMQSPRDYKDRDCKVVCMAECLAPSPVGSKKFFSIYKKTDQVHSVVNKLVDKHGVACHVNLAPHMFAG